MKNPYYYLYYRIYKFTKRQGKNDVGFSAILVFSFLLMINFISVYINILPVTKENFEQKYKSALIILGLTLLAINYLIFVRNNKYLLIEKRYENESKKSKYIGGFLVIIYAIFTIISIFFM